MAKFRYKGRRTFEANGYRFAPNEITEIRDDDTATLNKLRGSAPQSNSHPSFEEVFG